MRSWLPVNAEEVERWPTAAGSHAVWWRGGTIDVKLTGAQTDGHVGMWLWHAQRGNTAPLHVHHREDEQFLVIDGRARFQIGEHALEAATGDLVFLPRQVPHAYVILSTTAVLVGTVTPAGFESFFGEVGAPVSDNSSIETSPSEETFRRIAPRYGIEILGASALRG
jgi:quercetin dioxygenase-like cupin family protein